MHRSLRLDVCAEDAIRACAYNARAVALGMYPGQAQGLYLREEFHHNRINFVCSQISGVAPDLQHRWDRLRLVQTFMDIAVKRQVECTPLISHCVPANEAAAMYELLDERPRDVLLAVLDFRDIT